MTATKRQQLARELDTRVRYLRLTGLDDTALVAAMSIRMADFQALMDAAGPDGLDGVAGRLPNLRHFAMLLDPVAAAVRDDTNKAPEYATAGMRGSGSKRTENLCKAVSRNLSRRPALVRHTFATEKCPAHLWRGGGRGT